VQRVRDAVGFLATAALRRIDEELPWYRNLSKKDRSYVGLVAQAGITSFVTWFENPSGAPSDVNAMFAAAPRELTRSISLQHTLQLVRAIVDVVEHNADRLAEPGHERDVREAVLRYSREVAFSAADVYARSAEQRGAWDARLEALAVDAIVRGDTGDVVRSRVAALGWSGQGQALVIVGSSRARFTEEASAELRRAAARTTANVLVGIHDDRVIVVLGATSPDDDLLAIATTAATKFVDVASIVIGPMVDSVSDAPASCAAAMAGLSSIAAWPHAPSPVLADDLLPERVLTGDRAAAATLVEQAYEPLKESTGAVLETLSSYLGTGRSLEAAARNLYVHPNTVRYRLKKVAELTGWDPLDARESFVLQIALALGHLADAAK
jgi:DNA-binding PucR family transcriptional regulator